MTEDAADTDPQGYLLERLHEDELGPAQREGDEKRVADVKLVITAVQKHSPSLGLVEAETPPTCVVDNQTYPCAMLKHHARPYRDHEDFPKELLL